MFGKKNKPVEENTDYKAPVIHSTINPPNIQRNQVLEEPPRYSPSNTLGEGIQYYEEFRRVFTPQTVQTMSSAEIEAEKLNLLFAILETLRTK
jgi:hypothetical protein